MPLFSQSKLRPKLHRVTPQWLSNSQRFQQLSAVERQWLFDAGSLTTALKQASQGQFQLQVLAQRLERPRLDEAKCLSLKSRELALIREVLMSGYGQPWVFARSVIPLSTLQGSLRYLKNLDNRPLGALLFKDPSMSRSPLLAAKLTPSQLHYPVAEPVWARRSLFQLQGKPLLVCEMFLPTFTPIYG